MPMPLPTHTLKSEASLISSNDNTSNSGTDFDGEKQEATSHRLNYFAKPAKPKVIIIFISCLHHFFIRML